jgi:hypothetical protein
MKALQDRILLSTLDSNKTLVDLRINGKWELTSKIVRVRVREIESIVNLSPP